ncbi:MAG: rRNA methyltransferase [Clostridia bacterium]|nr:rRNA methyltransferase [Clostridia bacterium]
MAKTQRILSKNADYQRFEVLKTNRNKRYNYGTFLCEGVRSLKEARAKGWEFESLLYSFESPLSDWAKGMLADVKTECNYALTDALMADLSGKEDTSELMAVIKMQKDDPAAILAGLSDNPVIALFDRPSNRGNLGTIIRSADALGIEALVITGHAVDLYDPEVVVSTMGSFFNLPVLRLSSNEDIHAFIDALRKKYPNMQLLGTTAHTNNMIYDVDMTRPTMFFIGNETEGLNRHFREICDVYVKIPMAETSYASSFNVGCAATVMFYEAARQRGGFPTAGSNG